MRWKSAVGVCWLAPLVGCNQFQLAAHNIGAETAARWDDHKQDKRLRSEARMAWGEVCRRHPARAFTPEFADGFAEGFADHLAGGGVPQPPTVPPARYRGREYQNPTGQGRARDYLIGFQYGAEAAQASGRRQYLTVPVTLPGEPAPEPPPLHLAKFPPPPATSADKAGYDLAKAAPPEPVALYPAAPAAAHAKPAADIPLPRNVPPDAPPVVVPAANRVAVPLAELLVPEVLPPVAAPTALVLPPVLLPPAPLPPAAAP